jgi:hypothetical protein
MSLLLHSRVFYMSTLLYFSIRCIQGFSIHTRHYSSFNRAVRTSYFSTKTAIPSNIVSDSTVYTNHLKNDTSYEYKSSDDQASRKNVVSDDETKGVEVKSSSEESLMLKLGALKLEDLKAVYRKLGGKPGTMKKQQIVDECYKMLVLNNNKKSQVDTTSSVADSSEDTTTTEEVDVDEPNMIPMKPLQPIGRVRSLSSSTSAPAQIAATLQSPSDPNRSTNKVWSSRPSFQHPFGSRRDDRFESVHDRSADMILFFLGTASCVPSTSRFVDPTLTLT